jgi:hypothetical protein
MRSKVDRRDIQTHRQHGDLIGLILFFQNMKSRLKFLKYLEGSGPGLMKALFSAFSSRD